MGLTALLKLLDFVPKWVWVWLVLIVGLLVVCGIEKSMLDGDAVKIAQGATKLAQASADLTKEKKARADDALAASEHARNTEKAWQTRMEETDETVAQERRKTADAVRDGDVARSMLVADTARYAGPESGASANDPGALARAEARATALGKLLGSCDAVAADLGRDAEGLATQVRGLQSAYGALRLTP